jgi:hypothetical protein
MGENSVLGVVAAGKGLDFLAGMTESCGIHGNAPGHFRLALALEFLLPGDRRT